MLDFKDTESSSSPSRPSRPPSPTLISFTPQPTYTLGRRQAQTPSTASSSLSPAEILRLKAPLHIRPPLPTPAPAPTHQQASAAAPPRGEHVFSPAVLASPRGGLATYHGPGQVVLWPVMVIRSPGPLGYKQFSVRCYSRLLEDTTTGLLQRLFGLRGFTTDDPGVWVRTPAAAAAAAAAGGPPGRGGDAGEVRKISALGIHLRRHVSSLGAAVNLDMPTTGYSSSSSSSSAPPGGKLPPGEGEEGANPWARFVACGLEGKGVTCVQEELRAAGGAGIPGLSSEVVARAWAEELARRMGIDQHGVELVEGGEIEELVGAAEREGHFDAVGRDEL